MFYLHLSSLIQITCVRGVACRRLLRKNKFSNTLERSEVLSRAFLVAVFLLQVKTDAQQQLGSSVSCANLLLTSISLILK